MAVDRLSFKEMIARFDVTPRTLRYYEYIELLAPEKEGRSRYYGPREIARMTLILRARRWGFSLEDIRQWLEIYKNKGTEPQYRDFVVRADQRIASLEKELQQLEKTIQEITKVRDEVSSTLK
ncbi:MAG: MerR family transcriptional regulator [Boseongicola sp.]